MNDIKIRKAKESDLQVIKKLLTELLESMDDTEGIDKDLALENCKDILNETNTHLFVAEIGGIVIGFINFTIRQTLVHPGLSGLIDELVVTRKYREMGVGKKLIEAAAKNCKQLGCCELEVSTEITNEIAQKFYKSLGFTERGVILEKELI
ncbi:MAG: GNAT family N-acetyltransferase [Thermoplasmata archaeon]|nr:MAG: GNAT family N-acetyltransferase [Thermoplasmata archaeon]